MQLLFKKILYSTLLLPFLASATQTSLLIKIPTRSRPHQFFKTLDTYYQHLSFTIPYTFLITCDIDDTSMNNPSVIKRLQTYPHLEFSFSHNSSKVEAYNRDIEQFDFDILIAASDDMIPMIENYDVAITNAMKESFPDLDGVLNSFDGISGRQSNAIPIIGNKFYKRFGYIYHPSYKALACNIELANVSKVLKKERVIEQKLFEHRHPACNLAPIDELYRKNETYLDEDIKTFKERQLRIFDIPQQEIDHATPIVWSILMCTIEERTDACTKLCEKLQRQIQALGLTQEIEIITCKDKRGEHTIGYKRNILLDVSMGKYINYLDDDDDDISDNYIKLIYEKLLKNPDCVSLVGVITFNGSHPKTFIHSLAYSEYFEKDNIYYRPPNHWNPIRRSLAVQFTFPDINFGEDTQWAMAIARTGILRSQELIEEPYYFYRYNDVKDAVVNVEMNSLN